MRIAIAALAAGAVIAAAATASAECAAELATKIMPLPVWATSPNEGSTWGTMPVFLHICTEDQRTEWLVAPSVTWNSVIHLTGTVRLFAYPDPDTTLTVIASASTRINYRFLAVWQQLPKADDAWTDEATLRVDRSAFARFYGLGPDTPESSETSYTAAHVIASERRGYNLIEHVNAGISLGVEHDGIEDRGVPGLPLAPDVFPDTPGMHGATVLWQGVDVRYDDRDGGDYAEQGVRLDAWGAVVEGLSGSPTFLRVGAQARGVVPELSWLSGAARLAWNGVTASNAAFYHQSSLGGSFLLRGFPEGRFVDRQAWTIEAEQRIRVLQTHIFGVVADWRVDPFLAAGQVFGGFGSALSHPRLTGGVGLRAFVHPNLVGRLDVASGGEGLAVYVEIGYPY
ncbi:MAG TPA: BamA/TamA family outer membrane protein [Kofleriaceae bacterium]